MALAETVMAHPWTPVQIARALESPTFRARLALDGRVETGPVPIGIVLGRRVVDLLELDLVGVDPSRRRGGVARALLRSLLASERAAGIAEPRLELGASNGPAMALYEGLDFVVVGRRSRYYPDGDDALLLTKAFA